MSEVKVEEWGDRLRVTSPYHEGFVEDVKKVGGRWEPEDAVWLVPVAFSEQLERLLVHHYGSVLVFPEEGDGYIVDRNGRTSQGRLL